MKQRKVAGETLQYVDTGIGSHIPHIWAYQLLLSRKVKLLAFLLSIKIRENSKSETTISTSFIINGLVFLNNRSCFNDLFNKSHFQTVNKNRETIKKLPKVILIFI
ncbi:hypothetical protein KHA80_13970 [Anaerobacillus sp. HL2]|nr:hypothetical protein KHA80_13970 [Anaerobacillus sp. HL2]